MAWISPDEFFDREAIAETKHEYFAGIVHPRGAPWVDGDGADTIHGVLLGNLVAALRSAGAKRGWCVYGGDYRFQGVYPDVVVVLDAPVFIAEVVTWGTAGADLGEKARSYRASPTVRQCAYVSVNRAWVEIHTRDEAGRWVVEDVTGLDATCVLTGIDCAVGMAAVYEGALAR
jgi:hypothetical protein